MKVEVGDSDEEEEMELEEVVKEMQEDNKVDSGRKKHKRESLMDERTQNEDMTMLPLSPVHLQAQPEE